MLVTSLFGFSTSAYAGGWASSARSIKLNTVYNDSTTTSDAYGDGYYYDAFKFTLPAKGTIKIRLESENKNYCSSDGTYSRPYHLIYKSSNTDNYIWNGYGNETSQGYNSGGGYYYSNYRVTLSAGTYYFVTQYDSGGVEGGKAWGDYDMSISYTPAFSNTSITKVTAKDNAFKINWKECSNVTGYQIQYSLNKNMSKASSVKITKKSTTAKTIKNLKNKKTYYVRIRTYKTVKVNGKNKTYYGKWSGKKSVKTK
jgi:hypothetical protein